MKNLSRLLPGLLLSLFCSVSVLAQDSSVYKWNVSSHKAGDGVYDIVFTTQPAGDWKLYAPRQVAADLSTTELQLSDSSVIFENKFSEKPEARSFPNSLFGTARLTDQAVEWTIRIRFPDKENIPALLQGTLLYTYGREPDFFYPSTPFPFTVKLDGGKSSSVRTRIPSIDIAHPVNDCGDSDVQGKGLLSIFLLGLVGGFIALLTPCVFPMIPLTVSFFTKSGRTRNKGIRNAMLYGFFIFFIYVLLSLPFYLFNASPQVLNNISTNVWLNLFFFVIFLVFAVSFFGYFEITLPGGLASKTDSRSGLGSLGGIFFMAFTLAIVSFSCTGPILGSLLVGAISNNGGPMQLSFGMGGFGFGLALPFALFAVFPNWLQSIPKSGGWLNSVKVVLGFLEVAMAIKFLSNADLVKQWGIIKREVFIGIWVLVGTLIVLYLLGKIRFPHDPAKVKFTRTRWAFVALFAAATLYLVPGVTNTRWANLRLISGFPPPLCYSAYKEPVNCKRGFEPLRDYEEALTRARQEGKPVLIDFTGWACVNCRRMEEAVWTDPAVDSLMRTKYVVVSLYVDESRPLPSKDQTVYITPAGKQESIVTVGDRWTNFQIANFHATTQPQYAIISTDERALTRTKGYTPDPDKFAEWLECGLDAFEKSKSQADRN